MRSARGSRASIAGRRQSLFSFWCSTFDLKFGASHLPRQISREENKCFSGQAIFAKQMTKKAEQESDRHVIKAIKEINMQYLILLAVVSSMVLYVLIIAGCLCYVGRHRRRTF